MASSKRSLSLPSEILYRIPIEYLVGLKSICKQWYALLKDKRFIYKHFDLSQKRFIQVDRHNKSVQLFDPEIQALECLQGLSEICTMIHCDGLLLCQGIENSRYENLAVWNPYLRRLEWIEPSNSYKVDDVYGFGYDNVSRDNYKILRLYEKSDIHEVYDFKSKLWRSVDAALDSCVKLWNPQHQALSMNGSMYWIAQRKKGYSDDETEIFIQSFDFSRETFKDIGGVVPFETDCLRLSNDSTLVMSGFGGDRISLLRQHERVKIEVWITNKVTYDGVVSWSKCFHLTRSYLPTSFSSFPTYFIDHKTNNLMLYCGKYDVTTGKIDVNVYEMGDGDIIKQVVAGNRTDIVGFMVLLTVTMYMFQVWFRFLNKRRSIHDDAAHLSNF